MLSLKRIVPLLFLFIFFSNIYLIAQTRADLEKKKQNLQAQIGKLQAQLNVISNSKTATKAQVETLKKQITKREELINAYNDELNQLTKDIQGNEHVQSELEKKILQNKYTYAALTRFNYTHIHDANPPLYLINKENMQVAILQKLYAAHIHNFESRQIVTINNQRIALGEIVRSLKDQHDIKLRVLQEQQLQKKQLTADKQLHDKKYKELEATEKNLRSKLLAKKADAAKLNKQIEAIIRKEIDAARARARAEALAKSKVAKTTTPKSTIETSKSEENSSVKAPVLTSEMTKLANSFEGNKGKFNWPAVGTIVETFGTHPHPEVKDVIINNNGIDISVGRESSISSIFEGSVVAVFANVGYQNAVLVQHGDYYTVYANLATVTVSRGEKVKTHQVLGTIYTQPDTHKSILHFEIWKGTTKLNPQLWLGK